MKHLIIDTIAMAKVEGRKPRFTAPMVKFIVQEFRNVRPAN